MSKVPQSAKKDIPRKCPLCGKTFKTKEYLVNHIDKSHSEQIPESWSASRYENYLRTNKTHGNCVVCGKETDWNESTWKYNRICGNKKCSEKLSETANKNMIGKYGKVHLLNDPEQQRKMIYSKRNSGEYYWTTDTKKEFKKYYASSEELKFLQMLDVFLNLDPEDVMSPSPNNYVYKYEGKDHVYIPDMYIISINLEVEIKEPLNNQNMHPKIQAVDKVKEQLKDELMNSIDYVNYVKVNGTDYSQFFATMSYLKNRDTLYEPKNKNKQLPVNEGSELDDDDFNLEDELAELTQETVCELTDYEKQFYFTLNKLRISKSIIDNDFINPKLNYKDQVDKFKDYVKKCDKILENNPNSYYRIKQSIDQYKLYLKNIVNNEDNDGHTENRYEAKKALDELDKLSMALEFKYDRAKHKYSVVKETSNQYVLTESAITGEKNGAIYQPIFITLTASNNAFAKTVQFFTKSNFSHATLALDSALTNLYSFDARGFVDDSLEKLSKISSTYYYSTYMFICTQDEFNIIKNIIDSFEDTKNDFKYSIKGIINFIFGKKTEYTGEYFCSEFVAYLINMANPNALKKHYSLYSPEDLRHTHKFINLDEGLIKNFKSSKIDKKARQVLARKGFENVTIKQS